MPARPSRGGCKTAVALAGARVARVTATKGGAWRGAAGRAHGEVRGGRETCRRRKNKKKFPAWGVRELPRDGDIGCLLRLWEKKPDAGFKLLPERLLKLQWMADASPPACRTEINVR